MASRKRTAVKGYAGVFYVEVERVNSAQTEKVYYARYRRDGKLIEEKAGHQYRDNMTPAKAAGIRAARIEKKESTNEERREAIKKAQAELRYRTPSRRTYVYSLKRTLYNITSQTLHGLAYDSCP